MTYSPRPADATCRTCVWPVFITGDTAEKRDAAAAEWRACSDCRLVPVPADLPPAPIFEPDADMRAVAVCLAIAALVWLFVIAWLIGRAT